MKQGRRYCRIFLQRLISLTLAAYLLNFSVDSPDAQPDRVLENLSQNDVESFYELFLEEILGLEKAVAEHEEHDVEGGGMLDFKKAFPSTLITSPNRSAHLCRSISPVAYVRHAPRVEATPFNGPPPEYLADC